MNCTRYPSLVSMLSAQAQSTNAFEYFEKGERKVISYGEFISLMQAYPLPKEKVIGIFASTTFEAVLSIFSLIGKRRVVLLSPDDPIETLEAQIKKTHIGKLIGDEELAEEFDSILDKGYECEDKGVFFFTSGTTSKAKAVMLSETSLCNSAYNGGYCLPLSSQDRLLALLPLSHVFGFVCTLLWPLSFGATVCLGRGLKSIFFDFPEYKPTVTTLVPQMAGFLLMKNLYNPELKRILIGAGDCPDPILMGIKAKGIAVNFGYGLTETSSGIALSIGDNPRQMTICPDYEVKLAEDNEILVKCPQTMMEGYYEDEESTKKAIIDGYLHTGDLGKLEGNTISIIGRKKEILVFDDGSKLFLPEYEYELGKVLGQDADFAVITDKQNKVVLAIDKPKEVEERIANFNQGYPRSHRIAKIIYVDKPLPRTKTGKIMRYAIDIKE